MNSYTNPHSVGCYWHDAAKKYGAPNIKWCEETLCQVVSEPANTWSNLAYLVSAIILYYWAKKHKQPELTWLAPAMLLMGAGSFYYHMSNFYIGQILDFVGMYLFVFWLMVLNLRKAQIIKRRLQVPLQALIVIGLTLAVHLMYINHMSFQLIVASGVFIILITEFIAYKRSIHKRHYKWFYFGIIFIALAQGFSQLDLQRIWCVPTDHFWQGHALWHVLNSIGLTLSFKHWSQEDYSQEVMP